MLWLINLYVACTIWCKCRKQCFTTEFFKGCLEALQLQDEVNAIKSYIKLVNGADPNLSNWDVLSSLYAKSIRRILAPFSPPLHPLSHTHTHTIQKDISQMKKKKKWNDNNGQQTA